MRRLGILLGLLVLAACGASDEGPGSLPPRVPSVRPVAASTLSPSPADRLAEADAKAEVLVAAGVEAIVRAQNADGSFGGAESRSVRLALSSICTLALLADANTEFRGRHHEAAARALKFLLDSQVSDGPNRGYFRADGDELSRMHGQGFATLALSQGYGMFGIKRRFSRSSDETRAVLSRAVALIVNAQTRAGGWGYEPHEREVDEGSLTVCMLQALRGARNAGIHVDPKVVRRALDYIRNSQTADGSIRYSLHGDLRSSFELTAAGAATLLHGGAYFAPSLDRARTRLWDGGFETFIGPTGRMLGSYPFYGLFYAVQVLAIDPDPGSHRRLERYYPRIVDWFHTRFDKDSGTYTYFERPLPPELEYGPLYRTAFATLTLLIRHGALPIFAR